jgi:putative NADH-flavin reductase
MRIAIFGAAGKAGRALVQEALTRGHRVTAVVRDPDKAKFEDAVRVVQGDATDAASVAKAVKDQDVVVNATGPTNNAPELMPMVADSARAMIEGLKKAGVSRLLIVGGAGSLEVAPGLQLVDAPTFPAEYKAIALAHRDALKVYRTGDIDWTYFSPGAYFYSGERTGKFRIGKDQLLTDAKGESRLSYEDMAVAIIDEAENPQHKRERIAVAY